jgi:tetratricopeptide (TPR) repeat protein
MHAAITLAFALTLAAAQDVRQLYDAGRYQDVVRTADQGSRQQYFAAQSFAKLNDTDGARRTYQRLAGSPEEAWAAIGKSALQAMDGQLDGSLESANQAARVGASLPEAHYQRGLVLMARNAYGDAAGAFTKAAQLDPNFAAAHYYAGLANYRAKRIDLMTTEFETFVRLAPNAPERPEVEAILRTVRGK